MINNNKDSYNDKYIKIKIKTYGDKINTNFQGKKIAKENVSYKCLSNKQKVSLSNTSGRIQI